MSNFPWSLDMSSAPLDKRIILAASCGTVTLSKWSATRECWEMLSNKDTPIAWCLWPSAPTPTQVDAVSA